MMTATLYTESPTLKRRLRTYTVNGYSFQMVQVKKGKFCMGDDTSMNLNEKPARFVGVLQDFELGQHPVTQGLWEAVMGENPSYFEGATRPVENVSWDDIMGTKDGYSQDDMREGFLDRLNSLPEIAALNSADGCCFCLPSEAQWEFAARGGGYSSALHSKYSGSEYLPEVGWYEDNSHRQTNPIGSKLSNLLGLYDMSGNVDEWCGDIWYDNYKGAPEVESARIENGASNVRVVRGGSWDYNGYSSRVANRYWYQAKDRQRIIGFRLSRYRAK